jgi:hypothetical protein
MHHLPAHPHPNAAQQRLAACALALLWAGGAVAQNLLPDAELAAKLAAMPAPLTALAPKVAAANVVPAQVQRWVQEARDYEHGDNGVPRDPKRAATLYCQASQYGDAEAQYSLGWMLTNARGIERDDAQAAHMFWAAAEQGHPQAERMAKSMGEARGEPPPCLRPPEAERPRPVVVAAAPRLAKPLPPPDVPPPPNAPRPIVDFVRLIAPDYKLAPQLVLSIINTESGFNANAVSPKQAQGLMQLIPDTAARFKVRNLMDPAQNIRGGMAYLRWLMAYFEGDVMLVAAAYNAGERAVERYRGVPPYAETRDYVRRVMAGAGGMLSHPFDASVTSPSPALPLMRVAGLPVTRR